MEYRVKSSDDRTVIEVSGKVDRVAVLSSASYIRDLVIDYQHRVILDVDGLEDEREMFYHVALINTVKKEVEHAGGVFKLRATGEAITSYLILTGLEKLFVNDIPLNIEGEEECYCGAC